jgi:hypothetical protein
VVVEVFGAGAVGADVVGAPAASELVAAGGQFADQVVELLVVRVLPSGGAEVGDRDIGEEVPVGVEAVGGAVKEGEPGKIGRGVMTVVDVGVERPAEVVGGEQVRPVVPDYCRCGDGVEGPLQARPCRPLPGAAAAGAHGSAGAVGGVGEVEQVGTFGFVELEGAGDGVKNAGRDPAE